MGSTAQGKRRWKAHVRSARIWCESRLRWRKGANRLRETPSRRLVDLEPCGDDVDAGSVWATPGATAPLDDLAELLPEDEAGIRL